MAVVVVKPSPVDEESAAAPGGGGEARPAAARLQSALYIANWMVFSNLTIFFNKWIIDSAGFAYPILLTSWHLVFATVATQLLARTTTLLDSRLASPMTARRYVRVICPIGIFYTASLVCSNLVYLHLSVAFIQMLKAAGPIAVLLVSWALGASKPSASSLAQVLVIVVGVVMASVGEISFSVVGVAYQTAANVFEAIRLVMIEIMVSDHGRGPRMDPLVGLYYFAPVCAVVNLLVALPVEVAQVRWADVQNVGLTFFGLNALTAFMLNVASVFLIGKTSSLVMTLASIVKNMLLIGLSVVIWQTPITTMQFVGYAIALVGLVHYSVGLDELVSLSRVFVKRAAAALDLSPARVRKAMVAALIMTTCVVILYTAMA